MTERLYYTDAHLTEFDATILDVVRTADGRPAAVLDRTAFYPTSGGQPFDTGWLAPRSTAPGEGRETRVVDVVDRDDGVVLHVVEGDLRPGPAVGRIDWDRRFDHMQQHTGQHVLSAAFDRECQARTESFHLGTGSATIDLAREVSSPHVAAAELAANQVVWEDRPVSVRFVDESQALSLPLRKESKRTGKLRIVEVEGFDLSACGGTHVSRTGAIGNIAIASFERFRTGTRVEFRCGIRVLQGYRALRDTVSAAARLLSTGAEDLPAAVERLQSNGRETARRVRDLQEKLALHEASRLSGRADGVAAMVIEALDGWDAVGLKAIAVAIAERPGHAAILAGTLQPVSVVVARAPDVQMDAAAIVKALTAKFGGKGGGRAELAQGGGLHAPAAEIVAFARALV